MPNQFQFPSDPPSTPDRGSRSASGLFSFGENPSTTPAGPPPSSAATFTPAGAPSASYMGSSMMRGVTAQKPASFSSHTSSGSSRNLFSAPSRKSPLGRSIQASKGRQPSRLSKQVALDDDEEADEEAAPPTRRPFNTFTIQDNESDEDADADGEDIDEEPQNYDDTMEDDTQGDLWLNLDQDVPADAPSFGDESDLMMMATPAVDDRIRREAEGIFRASTMRSSGRRRRQFRFAPVAKGLYNQMGYAEVTESPQVILETEHLVRRLYNEGVGSADDPDRLDEALGETSAQLASLWQAYVESLPQSGQEHAAGIGPGPHATAFEHAAYLATLTLRVNHTRYDDYGEGKMQPLPETMFRWLGDHHNLYPGQVQDVQKFKPTPACHSLFWQAVFISLLQGRVIDALNLLSAAGWQELRRGSQRAYTDRLLANVQRAVQETIDMLQRCPGREDNWEVWSSEWTLFRIQARGALDQLRRFAEGKGVGGTDFADSHRSRGSMAGMARKAESQVPWDIYENLNIIFDIVLGSSERILTISQDWCEATVALFGWWDEEKSAMNVKMSRSQSLMLAQPPTSDWESYVDRLARSFQTVADSARLQINSNSPLEVGMACVFEDNPKGVLGILRGWSLPVAAAVAEIASLGGWLPQHQPSNVLGMDELDPEDLEVLGWDPSSPDEMDGIKDNTLIQYAQALVNYDELSSTADNTGRRMDGWELAIHVLGRMDSPQRSEETVGELIHTVLASIDVNSGVTVEKVWRLLNDLGMIAFAEDAAEQYGQIVSEETHRYGEAMWYFALAHRPDRVREVMNLLISYSLIQSTTYPSESDLDEHLGNLLNDRNMTLEQFAKQDLEAAELLGKMLSGYATLRKFYAIRDDDTIPLSRRRPAAATALAAVIASADDNIRGGLYDVTRDAVVSEDFLLALLGEALVFVNSNPAGPVISLETIDILLKAVEDVQAVGSRVFAACDEFFQLVLKSAAGLKGSKPADLMRKSSSSLSGASSYVMSGSSMLASQLHRSLAGRSEGVVERGWDWRSGLKANTTAEDVLRALRLGVSKDLAKLWIAEADGDGF